MVTWAGENDVVLRGGHGHRERNVFKHVHYLFRPCERDVDDEVESLLSLVENVGHRHGEDVGGGFDWSQHALGLGDKVQKFDDIFQGLLGNLIRVDLSDLS